MGRAAARAQLLAAGLAGCAAPTRTPTLPAEDALRAFVDATIQPVLSRHDIPGMSVAVTVEGRSHVFSFGVASRETNEPVRDTTLFELGSVSKTFTATLALHAQASGKLSLDDHPGRYLPRLAGTAIDRATLLQLGTYTAGGLPLQFPDEVVDDASMLRYFEQWVPSAEPGARRQYSNPSIGLLGHLTGLALHEEFSAAIENGLLPGLGLQHTCVHVPRDSQADYAWGHDQENQPVRVSPGVFDAQSYGIKSTARDVLRFVQLNIDPSGLEEPLRRAVEGTQAAQFQVGAMVQDLGWEQYPFPVSLEQLLEGNSESIVFQSNPVTRVSEPPSGARLFDKTGSTRGFSAYVAFVPQRRIGVVMLANRSIPVPERVRAALAILDWLAKHAATR